MPQKCSILSFTNPFTPPLDGLALLTSHELPKALSDLFLSGAVPQDGEELDRKHPLSNFSLRHTLARNYFVIIGAMSACRALRSCFSPCRPFFWLKFTFLRTHLTSLPFAHKVPPSGDRS